MTRLQHSLNISAFNLDVHTFSSSPIVTVRCSWPPSWSFVGISCIPYSVFLDKYPYKACTQHTHSGPCMPVYTPMEWDGKLYLYTVISSDYKWVYTCMGLQGYTWARAGIHCTGVYMGLYMAANSWSAWNCNNRRSGKLEINRGMCI